MLLEAPEPARIDAALIPIGELAEQRAMGLLADLRRAGVAADMSYKGNMKKRMAKADASGARFAVIIGDDELARGEAGVKNLSSGEQTSIAFDRLPEVLSAQ